MFNSNYDDVEEEDEDPSGEKEFGGKNVIIFLVDGSTRMHETLEGGDTLFNTSIAAINAAMKSKIFTSSLDVIGVVGFGTTNKVPETLDFNNISEICPAKYPCRDNIVTLEKLSVGETDFQAVYGGEGAIKLNEVLWHCQSIISEVGGKVGSRRILLLTCNDDPHEGDQTLNLQARRKAGDLQSNNIFLEVVPVNPPGQTFNMSTFYTDIVRLADDDWSGSAPDIHSLADTVIKKTFVKRTTSRLKFDLGGGVAVGVATYNLLGRAIKPAKTKMAKATNMELKSLRTWIHPVSGAPLLQSDMAKFMNYGSKNIKLLDAEVAHIRGFGDTENSLKLLGFRSASCLKTHHQVKLPQFLYPCEDIVTGSRSLFYALVVRCSLREKVAICSFKQRSSSGPNYVALLPQMEVIEDGAQVKAPGFHVIYLPFLDDIRLIPEIRLKKDNPPEAVDAAKAVISKLKLKKFIPVENATLQTCYRMVEHHALMDLRPGTMEKPEDETLPDLERMARKLGDRSQRFLGEVYTEGYNPSAPIKKPSAARPKVAKEKTEKEGAAVELDMETLVKAGTVNKLTVDVLKAWLKNKGVHVSNKKKAQLVEDVMTFF